MTDRAVLNDAECDAILRHTPYLCTDPHRTIVRAAYAAGQAAASVRGDMTPAEVMTKQN